MCHVSTIRYMGHRYRRPPAATTITNPPRAASYPEPSPNIACTLAVAVARARVHKRKNTPPSAFQRNLTPNITCPQIMLSPPPPSRTHTHTRSCAPFTRLHSVALCGPKKPDTHTHSNVPKTPPAERVCALPKTPETRSFSTVAHQR